MLARASIVVAAAGLTLAGIARYRRELQRDRERPWVALASIVFWSSVTFGGG